jgi:lactobin A/cerein 7B family class IIb bacteriocin
MTSLFEFLGSELSVAELEQVSGGFYPGAVLDLVVKVVIARP